MAPLISPGTATQQETVVGSEVRRGLTATPRFLSAWLFYDAIGSDLFEQITGLPEYYLTRTERAVLTTHAGEIVRAAAEGAPLVIVELGAGTAAKTGLVLTAALAHQAHVAYYPIDVSETALVEAKRHLELELPGVRVHPRVADYTEGLGRIDSEGGRKLVLYIGSSIGNFEPEDAVELLAAVRRELAPGDCLLLGADQVKDVSTLLAAYDDAMGVTAAFNSNVLRRINGELNADFNLECFEHEARWNAKQSRIEMHLRSRAAQSVYIRDLNLRLYFVEGETIHTENSYKFTDQRILAALGSAGFALRQQWKDERGWFGVYLAQAV